MDTTLTTAPAGAAAFFAQIRNPLKFRLFLMRSLPAAAFSGVRIVSASEEGAVTTVPYGWRTRNPFRSTYFAFLAMAAEMSTGVLAMVHIYQRKPRVSLLVVAVEGKFYKKATGKTFFECRDGAAIRETVEKAVTTGEAQTIRATATGRNENGEAVADFWITWSFKVRS